MKEYPQFSVVIPMYNMKSYIVPVLDAIYSQTILPEEIIIVDDGSKDGSSEEVTKFISSKEVGNIRLIKQKNEGAVSATNKGIFLSKQGLVCLIDSDAILLTNIWLEEVIKEFSDHKVGAVGGQIITLNKDNIWARIMGYDLEYRYSRISSKYVNHVSTCATMYRRKIFEEIGFFDKQFKYGYDHDISYRIKKKGYNLIILKTIEVGHFWKETLFRYLKEQFFSADGILKLIKKHPGKSRGNEVAGMGEYFHVPLFILFFTFLLISPVWNFLLYFSLLFLGVILLDRIYESYKIYTIKKDLLCFICLPFIHILRDFVWTLSIFYFLKDELKK